MNKQQKLAAAEVLERAGLVLSLPEWWTKEFFARNSRGHGRRPHEKDAVCFCAIGAVRAAGEGSYAAEDALDALANKIGVPKVALGSWNNAKGRTNIEVSDALLSCAAQLRGGQA